jgi:uncharacterized protein
MQYLRFAQENLTQELYKGRVLILYGARRVGKTTIVRNILSKQSVDSYYFDMEDPDNRSLFENAGVDKLNSLLQKYKLVVFDEAQKFAQIGQLLKLIHDHLPHIQIIATGSSSFDLSAKITESLTGRKWEFILYPISTGEIIARKDPIFALKNLEQFLIYGHYPDVLEAGLMKKSDILKELTNSYLLKDIFSLQDIRNPEVLEKLLRLLALQISNEVSFHEIATKLGINQETVIRYINLLEKAFVIFRLPAYSTNQRNELTKTRKIYFYDLGIRNSLIQNFNSVDLRTDVGALWENFCILERRKYLQYKGHYSNTYFWRNYQKQEIDYIEENAGQLNAFELQWNSKKKAKLPNSFDKAYPNNSFAVVNPDNWLKFVYPNQ